MTLLVCLVYLDLNRDGDVLTHSSGWKKAREEAGKGVRMRPIIARGRWPKNR